MSVLSAGHGAGHKADIEARVAQIKAQTTTTARSFERSN
jgi:hypothetical protein